jgi:2-oxoglutarate ferredoxin oxidoreductase subunit alpha
MIATEELRETRQRQPVVNDLTFMAATINGSGSQSSNLVLTRALFMMGIPVAPKNVFPSNIEGLPTWYYIRTSPEGYMARTDDVHVLVALNPTTWQRDVMAVNSGGAIIHEATYPVAGNTKRDDCVYYPVPFHKMGRDNIENADLRKYLTNMIYVGCVAWLLDIPMDVIERSLKHQFRRKPNAVPLNMKSIQLGYDYMVENHTKRDPFKVAPMTGKVEGKILIEGNQALALGAIMGGCTVAAWYPITPSSSVCEYLDAYANRFRRNPDGTRKIAIIQAEDELAAAGMVIGAGWAGARAMTSTSGPGISLMAEFSGLGYFAEIPAVICDIQRMGPSTGLPTRTNQGDITFANGLSHGDTKHPLLLPGSVEEVYEFGQLAFDLAERLQTPIFLMSDLDLGMNLWMSQPFAYPDKPYDRGKVLSAEQLSKLGGNWGRYRDVDDDGIPWRTVPGTEHEAAGYFTRGSGHDENARYSELPEVWAGMMDRLKKKYNTARQYVPKPVLDSTGSSLGIIAYGSSDVAVAEARDKMAARGVQTDYLRIRAVPFADEVFDFIRGHQRIYVVDQNRDGQMCQLLKLELDGAQADKLVPVLHYDGTPIPATAVMGPILVKEGKASESEFQRPTGPAIALAVEGSNS